MLVRAECGRRAVRTGAGDSAYRRASSGVMSEAPGSREAAGPSRPSPAVGAGDLHSKTECTEAHVVIRAAPQWPMKLPLGLSDRKVVDRGVTSAHQAVLAELPVLVPVGADLAPIWWTPTQWLQGHGKVSLCRRSSP